MLFFGARRRITRHASMNMCGRDVSFGGKSAPRPVPAGLGAHNDSLVPNARPGYCARIKRRSPQVGRISDPANGSASRPPAKSASVDVLGSAFVLPCHFVVIIAFSPRRSVPRKRELCIIDERPSECNPASFAQRPFLLQREELNRKSTSLPTTGSR